MARSIAEAIMIKRLILILPALLLGAAASLAQSRCRVSDPTGTPLNLREAPGGRVVGVLPNGAVVRRSEQVSDQRGRAWVMIHPAEGGSPLGWVFREFVSCW
jgi:hypothetical protein